MFDIVLDRVIGVMSMKVYCVDITVSRFSGVFSSPTRGFRLVRISRLGGESIEVNDFVGIVGVSGLSETGYGEKVNVWVFVCLLMIRYVER